ncbi:alpha/beta fold hydrolase [Rhizobium leguminosarum]|uniref:alpha/beta fold hydrolase n=1 Tax=Rhizobium leguminosarum TaxID=384 RepID=UPI003965824C
MPDGQHFILLGCNPFPDELSVHCIADDVAAIIKTQLGGRCRLVGVSYGAVVASNVAARFPDRVAKLALVAGAPAFSSHGRLLIPNRLTLRVRASWCSCWRSLTLSSVGRGSTSC